VILSSLANANFERMELKSKGWVQDGDYLVSPAFSADKPTFHITLKGALGEFKVLTTRS